MSIRSKHKTRAAIASQGKHSVTVRRSNNHFYAQLVSPTGIVMGGVSTLSKSLNPHVKKHGSGNCEAAKVLGHQVASLMTKHKITHVAFNRSGLLYHGRVAAFVNGMREKGVKL